MGRFAANPGGSRENRHSAQTVGIREHRLGSEQGVRSGRSAGWLGFGGSCEASDILGPD